MSEQTAISTLTDVIEKLLLSGQLDKYEVPTAHYNVKAIQKCLKTYISTLEKDYKKLGQIDGAAKALKINRDRQLRRRLKRVKDVSAVIDAQLP